MKQLAGGRQRPRYRLSPNEVEQLKKEETERRRKLRIVQVREQAKAAAAKIRQDVRQERKKQLVKLAYEIEDQLEDEKQEEVRRLEQQYNNTLRTIGQGHTQALVTDKNISHAERRIVACENKERANERHKEALRKVALDKAYKEYEETKPLRDRQAALMEEKKRSAEVAARPPPVPDPITDELVNKQKLKKPIPLTDMNAFSATHYHVPDFAVEKAPLEQQHDGVAAGDEEDQRTKEEISQRKKKEHDQLIRARIRGNEALKKEKLKHEYDALMADLSLQQRADRRRRQHVVAKLPKQVFLPPDRRMEELEDKQLEMERAFEDMYTKQMNLSGDLSLTLDTNPLAPTTVKEADDSLEKADDSPVVVPTMPTFNPALRELTNVSGKQGQAAQQGKPETALKKLLNKIKEQRSEAESDKTQEGSGQENLGADYTAARQPVSKPAADPQLDLSPLKAPGNQKPQKSPVRVEEHEDKTSSTDISEAGFLQQLQGRLEAIEAQRDHLDRVMRERQQHQELQQQQQKQIPGYVPPAATEPRSDSQGPTVRFSTTLEMPHSASNPPARLGQWVLAQAGGPTRDAAVSALEKPGNVGDLVPSRPLTAPSGVHFLAQPYEASTHDHPAAVVANRADSLGTSLAAYQMSAGSGYPSSSVDGAERPAAFGLSQPAVGLPLFAPSSSESGSMGGALLGNSNLIGSAGRMGAGFPHTHAVSAPLPSSTVPLGSGLHSGLPSVLTQGTVLPSSSAIGPFVAVSGFSTAAAGVAPSVAQSQPLSSSFQPTSHAHNIHPVMAASQPQSSGFAMGGAGDSRPAETLSQSQGSKPAADLGTLASRLAAGLPGDERLRSLREYQQQLIQKHQERMKTLQDTKAAVEARQAGTGSGLSSLPSTSRLADPMTLVPYTLKASPLSSSISSSLSAAPGPSSVVPRSTAVSGGVPTTLQGLGGFGLGRLATTVSTVEGSGVPSATEPILAGSSGVTGMGLQSQALGARPSVLSDGGDRKLSAGSSSSASKLDSVRRSLPFDTVDDTPQRGEAEGEAVDTDGVSLADDSHMSSSTERGSPALGSRSNKSSTSGKSGSGMSGVSDGSLGGSSLVARAEEKRLSFEQRQRELQGQLAEIQRQKDALLQRYHGNQQRVSAQEESLRSKLKTVKAATSLSASASASLSEEPVMAVGLGVHQSYSPSMELEEGSLSSERPSGRSWAMELEEFSLSRDKSGEGVYKSPGSMTLEEYSITSDRSGGVTRESEKVTEDRSMPGTRPGSSLSSLEEYSIVSGGRPSAETAIGVASLSARGSRESLSVAQSGAESASQETPDSARGPLDIKDLMQEVGDRVGGQDTGQGRTTWSEVLRSGQFQGQMEEPESSRLPPPPTRQPVPITDYQPHELSTILEVDTPQTATRNTLTKASPTTVGGGGEGAEKSSSRRYIDFGRHGTGADEDRESKFSASGSSASSDVRSVIEVRPSMLKSEGTASTGGSVGEMSTRTEERDFRANILESSSMKGVAAVAAAQGGEFQLGGLSQDLSYASTGQGFRSLELTLDSLTPRSASADDAQVQHHLESNEPEVRRVEGRRVDDVLRQARQFNQELMSTIQRQSADVFDQSSLSALSQTAVDNSQVSQQ